MRLLSDIKVDPAITRSLIDAQIPSRIRACDASIYDFSLQARDSALVSMGWTTLASEPPFPLDEIVSFAEGLKEQGIRDVILIGQGGSTQAAMVLTKLCLREGFPRFNTIDYLFPSMITELLDSLDLARTVCIVASKSGSTIEPLWIYQAIVNYAEARGEMPLFVAITDAGSPLEKLARQQTFDKVFPGADGVGGRFSGLSVFGLIPAACAGADITEIIDRAARTEKACSLDSENNPALELAAFLYSCLREGRDKFSLIMPQPGRVFGLWVEQLIAESLGKDGQGILPNIEIDPSLILNDHSLGDRCVVSLCFDEEGEIEQQARELASKLPVIESVLSDPLSLGSEFVVWEYATAMLAYLMQVDPFNQPDVAETKRAVDFVLSGSLLTPPEILLENGMSIDYSQVIKADPKPKSAFDALQKLFGSIEHGDYFALLSYIPFHGTRRATLEKMRHCVAEEFGVPSCLEIGPRYLHSTGQLYKGGPNTGTFLILSADDPNDLEVGPALRKQNGTRLLHEPTAMGLHKTLGTLLSAQARGDLAALSNHRRRALHIHLPDWSEGTFDALAEIVCLAAESQARR